MSYALISDIPASWERYQAIARLLGSPPDGLVLHIAGPTDEGFRIIEVWETEAAWLRFADLVKDAIRSVDPRVGSTATVRDLRAVHVVVGPASAGTARGSALEE